MANGSGGGSGQGSGNLANDAVAAALAYRAQAPVLDGLMKELGLDGSSLGKLVEGATDANTAHVSLTNDSAALETDGKAAEVPYYKSEKAKPPKDAPEAEAAE